MKKLRPPRIRVSDFTKKLKLKGSMPSRLIAQIENISEEEYIEALKELKIHGLIKYTTEKIGGETIHHIEM